MRLPNSFGSVYKMKGELRNPWRVIKTVGWKIDKNGKRTQIRKTIGYAPTKKDGLIMLANYNESPYEKGIKFKDLYKLWSDEHFKEIGDSTIKNWEGAYRRFEPIYNKDVRSLRTLDLENVINNADCSSNIKVLMKSLLNQMYKYAMRFEYVDKNYAELMKPPHKEPSKIQRHPFTDEEIALLWQHTDDGIVRAILVNIYSGFRPQELMELEIDRENMVFRGGMKTKAGKDRVVPIHPKIVDILDYTRLSYPNYYVKFMKVCESLGIESKPHNCRVTFASLCSRYGVDEWMMKIMLGHAISDLTHRVYIKKTIDDYRREIEKIVL